MVRSALVAPGSALVARAAEAPGGAELRLRVERVVSAWIEEDEDDGVEAVLTLSTNIPDLSAHEVFDTFGHVPLPPYMRRDAEDVDRATYQTVYASKDAAGSVAAPTAGLHFSPEVMSDLQAKGVRWTPLALHVGAGTFRPVIAERIAEHDMHRESFAVEVGALREIIASLEAGRPLVPVGTTAVRTLESLYWLAAGGSHDDAQALALGQWDAYRLQLELGGGDSDALPPPAVALQRLCDRAARRGEAVVHGTTSLCIAPGYNFKLCDALVTNFHQPDSTLLLLVAALAGRDSLKAAYQHAVEQRYRFLSYGDASLFFNAGGREQ